MKNYSLKLKHFGLLIAFSVLAGSSMAQSKLETLMTKLGDNNKMTVVNISKEMLGSMMNTTEPFADSLQKKEMKDMANDIGYMRIVSSANLTSEEQTNYKKMIVAVLSDGYKDLMSVSAKELGRQTDVRMCVKPLDKDNISEFIIYVSEGNELSLIAIIGKIQTAKMMELSKLSNLKGMINQTVKSF